MTEINIELLNDLEQAKSFSISKNAETITFAFHDGCDITGTTMTFTMGFDLITQLALLVNRAERTSDQIARDYDRMRRGDE